MSRRSQTELAVLGALSHAPMTGYEIRKSIEETIGHFWSESFGQLYPTIARLEEDGAIRRTSPGRTSGSQFEVTDAGMERLRAGLSEDIPATRPRNALLFRLFLGSHLPPSHVDDLLDRAEAQSSAAAVQYDLIASDVLSEVPSRDRDLRLATVNYGRHMARAQQEWVAETRALLATGDQDQ